jgi:hypothetical protein
VRPIKPARLDATETPKSADTKELTIMAAVIFSHAPRFERRRARYDRNAELKHVRDLLRLRKILARNGATAAELVRYDAEIDRQRRRLREPNSAAA